MIGESYLYVASEGPDGPVKIGRSNSPWSRVGTLQTGNSRPIAMVAMYRMPTDWVCEAERDLHLELECFHIKGEWFDCSVRFLAEYIPTYFKSVGIEGVDGTHPDH